MSMVRQPGGHYWEYYLGTLLCCSSQCHLLEDQVPVDSIYQQPIFRWSEWTWPGWQGTMVVVPPMSTRRLAPLVPIVSVWLIVRAIVTAKPGAGFTDHSVASPPKLRNRIQSEFVAQIRTEFCTQHDMTLLLWCMCNILSWSDLLISSMIFPLNSFHAGFFQKDVNIYLYFS